MCDNLTIFLTDNPSHFSVCTTNGCLGLYINWNVKILATCLLCIHTLCNGFFDL